MSLHADLLQQAQHLATKERRRPRQASLRRAISAAYYALFHLLVDDGARVLSSGTKVVGLRQLLSRAFNHGEMYKASRSFSGGTLPNHITAIIGPSIISPRLRKVATAFVELQEQRHLADYDLTKSLFREEVMNYIDQAQVAFDEWQAVRNEPVARLYLVALFAWDELRT